MHLRIECLAYGGLAHDCALPQTSRWAIQPCADSDVERLICLAIGRGRGKAGKHKII